MNQTLVMYSIISLSACSADHLQHSCETALHYVPLPTLMVLFDQNKFRLNKTGLHMVNMNVSKLDLDITGCLDVTAHALALAEHCGPKNGH